MPFFGRQGILAKTAAAGASGDRGYWQQATAVTSGNGNTNTAYAQFIKTSAITSNTRNVAISLWFKVSASDFDPDSGLFVLVSNYQGASSRWAIDFEQTGGITFYYSDGSVKSVSTGSLNSTFESTYVDGNWHHFFGQIQPGDSAKCKIYLDGADRTTNTSSMTGNAITADTYYTVGNRDDNLGNIETTAQFANCYVLHGSTTDLIPNISYFYNDGFVDLGTDGTASGAPAPTFYSYVSGGALTLGAGAGTLSAAGSSTLTQSNTGGPTSTAVQNVAPFIADANTKLLLHLNGTNGGTTITDNSGTGKTVTASGGANTDTGTKKYGSASGEMTTDDDIFTVTSSTDFNFGTGDFTIESWVYSSDWTAVDDKVLWEGRNAANGGNAIFLYDGTGEVWYVYKNASLGQTSSGHMTANTWQHVAWVRASGVSKIYIDGTERASFTDTNTYNFNVNCIIGSDYASSATRDFNGYIDEFRVSNKARYTTTFTPGA